MEQKMTTISGKNFTSIETGSMNEWKEKVFLKDVTSATATEISISTLQPNEAVPFFHAHKQNEETYIILSGKGDFQVDDQCFPIQSGSVVRVAPEGNRSMRNTANEPMHYIVVQAKQHSLEQFTFTDAAISEQTPLWK